MRLLFQTDLLQQLHRLVFSFLLRHFLFQRRGNRNVFQNRQMREDIEVLEHHADLLPMMIDIDLFVRDIHAFKYHLAAARFFQKI